MIEQPNAQPANSAESAPPPIDGHSSSRPPSVIDLAHEQLIPFKEVPNVLPRVHRGRKRHVGSIFRWADRGLKGVKLEYLQVGGVRCTSIEALQRFFERITFPNSQLVSRSFAKRQREIKRATQEVQRLLYGGDRRRRS